MGGAPMGTIRAMSFGRSNLSSSKTLLSQFSTSDFLGESSRPTLNLKKCVSWDILQKSGWTWTSRQSSWAFERSLSDAGPKGFRMPILDRNMGYVYLRVSSGNETCESTGTPAPVLIIPTGKGTGARGQTPRTVCSPRVKANLPVLDSRSRRLTDAKVPSNGPPLYSKAARRFYNQKFQVEPRRLSKVLAAAGVASRRGCEEIIFEGRVAVNGSVCRVPQTPVDPLKDTIYVDGHSLRKNMAPKVYFALNKPKGYICSAGEEGTKPVLSFFDDYFKVWAQRNPGLAKPRIFTVGRLDVATSGLLLVTNDGEFAQKVSHPSSGLTKEYSVTVDKKVTRRQLQMIANGTLVQGVHCVPTEVGPIEREAGDDRQRLRIVVSEGRNHEVRHLVERSGLQVMALKRVRIGGLRLSRTLGIGKFDVLTEMQVAKVLDRKSHDVEN